MPSSTPTGGGLVLGGPWGAEFCRGARALCSLLPSLTALQPSLPSPCTFLRLGSPRRAAPGHREGSQRAQCHPSRATACCWEEAAGRVTGPVEVGGARQCLQPNGRSGACVVQPPENPLSSASPSPLPLWCWSCLGPCSRVNSHRKLSWSGGGCGPRALMAWPQLMDGTPRLYLLSAQGPAPWWDTRHKTAHVPAIKPSGPPNQVAASEPSYLLLWGLSEAPNQDERAWGELKGHFVTRGTAW